MSRRITIFDTTLRDGEQSPGASLSMDEKLIIAKQLARMGVDVIEAGFPIASEGDFQAVKAVAQKVKGPTVCGLARTRDEDIDRCWEAVKHADKPRIHAFLATSDIHMKEKLRMSRDEVLDLASAGIKRARSHCEDVEFSAEDATRSDLDFLCQVVETVIDAGVSTVNLPDTVGYAEPVEHGNMIKYVLDNVPKARNITLSVHCHDDLGNAVANSMAAVMNGANQVECCINGLGERAGNTATEEVVMNLITRKDRYNVDIGVVTNEIYKTSKMVSKLTGIEIQRNKAIVGQNAFAHESGVHQHGMLMSRETYEIMRPSDIGWTGENIVIGKHSGKHAVKALLEEQGYELSDEQIISVTAKVKELADKQKIVESDDIIAIATDTVHQLSDEEKIIKLLVFSVSTGDAAIPTASVKLEVNGEEKIGVGSGVGPIDALSNAIWDAIGPTLRLANFKLKAITGGTNALADVSIKLEDKDNNFFFSSAVNEDVIRASAMAMIKGVNKAYNFWEKMRSRTGTTAIKRK